MAVALAVAAVLVPVGWLAGRPAPDAGVPLADALAVSPQETLSPSTGLEDTVGGPSVADAGAAPSAAAGTRAPGDVAVRDASVDAMDQGRGPDPVRLEVPSLGVDAAVDAVGVEDDGSMVIPAEVDRVGWYRFGPEAGAAAGNAVIAGHVDTAAQGPGALFDLQGVEVGAEMLVTDGAGTLHRYTVISRERMTKSDLPVDTIFARTGEHRLVVITCGGDFLPETRSYADNVIITAVPAVAG